ncbi:MAG: EscU/YscU/HrcU family type III secretion system export apparatus switch protein [Deltaproteobacteria bacterium]|nr:EscU/YscU/HrcU family type III secretion system export apparatus switch protein [Deltaproteobacteria bacterium]
MAQDHPGGEPTEPPTPKRLQKAKEQGQIAKSRDLSGAVIYWAGIGVILGTTSIMAGRALEITRAFLGRPEMMTAHPGAWLGWAMTKALVMVAPLLGVTMLASAVIGAAQARGVLTLSTMKPKLQSLDPIKGLGRMFGKDALFNLIKTLIVFAVGAIFLYSLLKTDLVALVSLTGVRPDRAAQGTWSLAKRLLVEMGGLFVVVGLADYMYQRHRHYKRLMMTKYEVKRENKESEGDPQHKAKRRQLHQEILQQAMVQSVEKADFVVVNPTRLAVAMRYQDGKDAAPVVVAKGQNLMAQKIRDAAKRAGVPIYRDVSLARALWELELDQEIPEKLYDAVAAILKMLEAER